MKKAAKEIHQVVGKDRLVQESDIPNLPYLQAIEETFPSSNPTVPMIQENHPQGLHSAGDVSWDIAGTKHIVHKRHWCNDSFASIEGGKVRLSKDMCLKDGSERTTVSDLVMTWQEPLVQHPAVFSKDRT
ncbi:cytochrome P450 93A3-like protein [Tanacetum coccineum]